LFFCHRGFAGLNFDAVVWSGMAALSWNMGNGVAEEEITMNLASTGFEFARDPWMAGAIGPKVLLNILKWREVVCA